MTKKSATDSRAEATVVRFSVLQRLEHFAIILLFLLLLLTGLPQKWPEADWSRWLVDAMGGIFAARFLHRFVGWIFAALTLFHLAHVAFGLVTRRSKPTMFLTAKDFRDSIETLQYYLGRRSGPPAYGRFDYRQKFEYWGLVFGSLVMVLTGAILSFPILFSRIFPAELIPASKVMHSNEAMLAMLIVIVWHTYTAHLNPDVFPFDSSIFTGRLSKERLRHEHRLEYDELFGSEEDTEHPQEE